MKKILIALCFSAAFAANPPGIFPYGVPVSDGSTSDVICDSACQATIGPGEGVLYRPQDSNIVAIPNGGVGQILTSRGPGLRVEWTNPTGINAFAYGPGDSLVSNPVLANSNARYVHVKDTTQPGDTGGVYITGATAANDSTRYLRFVNDVSSTWVGGTAIGATTIRSMATDGSRIVAVGGTASNVIFTSDDQGVNWTSRTSASTGSGIEQVIWAQSLGLWVAVGDRMAAGTIQTSPDGTTWTQRHTLANGYFGIAWSGTTLVAVTFGGVYTTSPDGITWTNVTSASAARAARTVAWDGTQFIATNGMMLNTSPTGATWTAGTAISTTPIRHVILAGTTLIAVGDSGKIYTSSPGSLSWTRRSAGVTTAQLNRANYSPLQNRAFATGIGGVIVTSVSTSTTWGTWFTNTSGTASDLHGMVTTAAGTTLAGGASGVQRVSQPMFSTFVYATEANRNAATNSLGNVNTLMSAQPATVSIVGQINITVNGLTPTIVTSNALAAEVDRGFLSIVYASNGDRTDSINPLGSVFYEYQYTPLVVIIPDQLTFNIGALVPAQTPFDFDVVTINDMVFALFVQQNGSLPQPYFGWNSIFDFGTDMRFEYGPESNNQYAGLTRFSGTTGKMRFLISQSTGNPGGAITWDTAMVLDTNQNVLIGTSITGTGAMRTLTLSNTGIAPSTSVDLVHVFGSDISAGNAAFSVFQEAAVSAAAAVVSTDKWPVKINGTTYYILMTTVP